MQDLTPQQIVDQLDAYIIGQALAKRAVAVAIRNRWRRQKLEEAMSREVYPKNIIMVGPTGVGKTEIARRLAKLTGAPFVKVEASKFTEVGYHGRDVESIVRDLLDQSLSMVRSEQAEIVRQKAEAAADERLVDLLLPEPYGDVDAGYVDADKSEQRREHTRSRLKEQLVNGKLDDKEVELTVSQKPATSVMFANMGLDQMDPEMANVFERLIPEQSKSSRMAVKDARRVMIEQETEKLLDKEKIVAEAIHRAEQSGIVFLDEIDKIATGSESGQGGRGPDVSRQGVQRDLLPIVEGSAVSTRYGVVHTDHVLFIAAGAFHVASVSDLMPELQGRFPIRVELSALTREDFIRILTEPDNALTKQQEALLAVEGLRIEFREDAIAAMADFAARANAMLENIGARRLMTIVETVFEEIDFHAPQWVKDGQTEFVVTADYVNQKVSSIVADEDLSKFVL